MISKKFAKTYHLGEFFGSILFLRASKPFKDGEKCPKLLPKYWLVKILNV